MADWEDTSYVGKDLGRHDYDVTEDAVRQYIEATRDRNPWYTGDSPFGGPVAPALFLHAEQYRFPISEWYLPNLYGNLHIRQEWELFAPIMVGEHIYTQGMIVDRYIRKDRDVVLNEFTVFNADGVMVQRGRCHQSFLLDTERQDTVVGKGQVTRPSAAPQPEAEAIEEIPPVERLVDLELCMAYSGSRKNYHNDPEEARKLGFPDVVVQGTMSTTFISEMLTNRFGEGWYRGGKMVLKLVNVLWAGETVTARGVIRRITPEGRYRRAHLDVWTEKADGTKTIAGEASALLLN